MKQMIIYLNLMKIGVHRQSLWQTIKTNTAGTEQTWKKVCNLATYRVYQNTGPIFVFSNFLALSLATIECKDILASPVYPVMDNVHNFIPMLCQSNVVLEYNHDLFGQKRGANRHIWPTGLYVDKGCNLKLSIFRHKQ